MRGLVAVVVVVMGCGPVEPAKPRPGDACATSDEPCFSSLTKLICDNGVWLEYPCDGSYTHAATGQTITGACIEGNPSRCVPPKPALGGWCPTSQEGSFGRCLSGEALAKCVDNAWTACRCQQLPSRPGCEEYVAPGGELGTDCAVDQSDPCWAR